MNEVNHTSEFDTADIEANKVISALAYLGILFFLPLVAAKDSKFGRFHANQGLIFFITAIALNIVTWIITAIIAPVGVIVSLLVWLIDLALLLYGIINTAKGQAKELPIIGKFRFIK